MAPTISGIELDSVQFCHESGTYEAAYDHESTSPVMAIVAAVGNVLNTDPIELDPLSETVDGDALERVLQTPDPTDGSVQLSLSYADCDITVSSDGHIQIAPEWTRWQRQQRAMDAQAGTSQAAVSRR